MILVLQEIVQKKSDLQEDEDKQIFTPIIRILYNE